jgi:hypothetical protein
MDVHFPEGLHGPLLCGLEGVNDHNANALSTLVGLVLAVAQVIYCFINGVAAVTKLVSRKSLSQPAPPHGETNRRLVREEVCAPQTAASACGVTVVCGHLAVQLNALLSKGRVFQSDDHRKK